ncbi:toprim domain-containing protein [Opitutaceae bacterium]|nr:toprim domain-containing protein [Opitutaceae bacterium]
MSTPDLLLEEAKRRTTITSAWRHLGLPNPPLRETGTVGSPFRKERKASFSIYADGRLWEDKANGEGGDVIAFIERVLHCGFRDAKAVLMQSAGMPTSGSFLSKVYPTHHKDEIPKTTASPERMPDHELKVFYEGIDHLIDRPELCHQVDQWRHWPEGTTRIIAEDNLISCPKDRGNRRSIAFPVQVPFSGDLDLLSTYDAGYHQRHKPKPSEKAGWSYSHKNIGSWPFVMGGGHIALATSIHICEGQWDAIALAAHQGWLNGDTTWPDRNVVFGTRGAGSTRLLLEHWLSKAPLTARMIIYPDADEAGDKATEKLVTDLQCQGFNRIGTFMDIEHGQDLSDYLRTKGQK